MTTPSLHRLLLVGAAAASLALGGCRQAGNSAAETIDNEAAQGKLAVGYSTTEFDIVRAMLDLAQVTRDDVVVDLGSGDGRIPIMAAGEKGARGLGIELDPNRVRQSRVNAEKAGVSDRVEFHQQDLFVTPLADVTVLTLYLLPEINLQLRPRILAQMRPGSRVVSNSFDMGDWRPDRERAVGETRIFLWVVPAKVEGRWRVQLNGGGGGELTLSQSYQHFTGRMTSGGSGSIADGRLQGAQISFTADFGGGSRSYQGRVEGNVITGSDWRAVKTEG